MYSPNLRESRQASAGVVAGGSPVQVSFSLKRASSPCSPAAYSLPTLPELLQGLKYLSRSPISPTLLEAESPVLSSDSEGLPQSQGGAGSLPFLIGNDPSAVLCHTL